MDYEEKAEEQLINEVTELRRRLAELQALETTQGQTDDCPETDLRYRAFRYRAIYIRQRVRGLLWR